MGRFKPPASYFFSVKSQDNSKFRFPESRFSFFRQTLDYTQALKQAIFIEEFFDRK